MTKTEIMSEGGALLLAGISGLMMGFVFFGGLWWTVRNGVSSRNPAFWFIGSLIFRMSLVLTGFYLISRQGNWQLLVSCLIGFMAARVAVFLLTVSSVHPSNLSEPRVTILRQPPVNDPEAKESNHAS